MGRKIVIASGKGGVGKTTLTANLAYRLATLGERVVAVDGDFGLNNLDVAACIEGKISYDVFDCIDGKCRVKQALVQSPWHKNLYILPARFGRNRRGEDANRLKGIADELSAVFDYVLIDCPAGVDEGFRRAVSAADEAIVVITPHVSSIRDADKAISAMLQILPGTVSVAVNKMRGDLAASGDILSAREIASLLKAKLVAVIPEDDGIAAGNSLGGSSGRAFKIFADNVKNKRNKVYDCSKKYVGFFGSIRRRLKRIL